MISYDTYITPEEYMKLRKKVGWCEFPLEEAEAGIKNSYMILCARDNEKAVGVMRLLWDGGYIAFLSDVIVDPEYQGKGIGKKLVEICYNQLIYNGYEINKSENSCLQKNMMENKVVNYYEKSGGNNMDNTSVFRSETYDDKIKKVIPYYDDMYSQIAELINTYFDGKSVSVLETGCGTGRMAVQAFQTIDVSEMVLCDPSEHMLEKAKEKLAGHNNIEFIRAGSEELEFDNRFDVVTAVQCHHYFGREMRVKAVRKCFEALKPGGLFICFENTAPFSDTGRNIVLKRIEKFGLDSGRTADEVNQHTARYNTEYFPITVSEHLELMKNTGFSAVEVFWLSYLQSGYYALK